MNTTFKSLMGISLLTLLFTSCKKNNNPDTNDQTINYALSVTGGTYPNQTTYVFGTKAFPSGTVSTTNAAELSSSGQMYKYGSEIYVASFGAPATLRKYSFDETGKPKQSGSIAVPGLNTFGAVEFISATEAYAASNGFGGIPQMVRFNPSTMEILGYIDLSTLQLPGASEIYYLGLVERDGYLFMGVNYQNASFENLEDAVFVAVINKNTSTVEKLIKDTRTSMMWNGGTTSSFSPTCLVKDAAGDIYVNGYANNGKPSGILKISKGTTEFDTSYFFDLDAVTGGHCLGVFYFDNDHVFTVRYADESAYPFDGSAAGELYKINLSAKSTSGNISATLPKFFGGYTFMTRWDNEKIYFNVAASGSNAIYSYTTNGGTVTKEFDLTGQCNGFTKIN
ncbi:MAG: DUF4374 domain-containing protein [Agriterribacter sp.]